MHNTTLIPTPMNVDKLLLPQQNGGKLLSTAEAQQGCQPYRETDFPVALRLLPLLLTKPSEMGRVSSLITA